jgi:hypothetical protein
MQMGFHEFGLAAFNRFFNPFLQGFNLLLNLLYHLQWLPGAS